MLACRLREIIVVHILFSLFTDFVDRKLNTMRSCISWTAVTNYSISPDVQLTVAIFLRIK